MLKWLPVENNMEIWRHFDVVALRTINDRNRLRRTHHLADTVEDEVDELSADCVVASGVVIGSILLTRDQLLWVEQLAVWPRPHLVCNM